MPAAPCSSRASVPVNDIDAAMACTTSSMTPTLDLCDTGRIGRDAYRRLVFPIYYRSQDELIAPVLRDDSPLAGRFRMSERKPSKSPSRSWSD